MSKQRNTSFDERLERIKKRPIAIEFIGILITALIIVATLDISRRHINIFISTWQKYIISAEAVILAVFIVELLARLITLRQLSARIVAQRASLRLMVRIVGYSVGAALVISILASNPTLGISIGAITGIVITFATQNTLESVVAAVLILNSRMVQIGEEVTIDQTTGTVVDITLMNVVIDLEDQIALIPNTLLISSMVKRQKRDHEKHKYLPKKSTDRQVL